MELGKDGNVHVHLAYDMPKTKTSFRGHMNRSDFKAQTHIRGLIKIAWCVSPVMAALLAIPTVLATAQVTVMPGSVIQGERLLDEKGCLRCHAVNGRGGK